MYLNQAKPKQYFEVTTVEGTTSIKQRLMELGFVPHTKLFINKVSPFLDPLAVTLRHYTLIISKKEASLILVREINT